MYLYVLPLCQRSDYNLTPADISGVPGTGKTATVHAVVRELKRMAEQNV
jgi:Cdc6-like AAA superfamily ATPase